MNSTKEAQLAQVMGGLFDQVLMPLSERMRAEGKAAFPLAPDVSWLSYYNKRRRSAMSHDDFTSAACRDTDELARRLATCWHALGRHEFAAQAARFGAAAAQARPLVMEGEAKAELSPYIYAMF
ncbi:hypothetical protein [Massilia cavernae]|uniref:Uncharacterized protein n=1 Tax=Massilia cavernae TaxID=2320864 RepID=A0A418Y875_9BURK|nr:hypothetical protein [Massilia cavernae]RJG27460.1 hypothetical protein D3872_01000 [Massilia cavernae]